MTASDVVFTTGSNRALDLLLGSWPGIRTVACLPGEYGPNLAIMAANGFEVSALSADGDGRLLVDEAAAELAADPPALVHLTPLASHRGLAQPMFALAEVCRGLGVPLVIDAAQALGHLDCTVDTDSGRPHSGGGSRGRSRAANPGLIARTPTPRGPAIHLRDEE